jgi:Phospholipase_D-nuclease N-terminal
MLDWLAGRLEVSPTVAAILLVLIVVEVTMQLYALVDLTRRSAVRGGRKWVWALVIALGNLPGAIAYLAAGRTPSKVEEPTASGAKAAGEEAVKRAVDALYGHPDRH